MNELTSIQHRLCTPWTLSKLVIRIRMPTNILSNEISYSQFSMENPFRQIAAELKCSNQSVSTLCTQD
jgi:hypothetical protein